MYKYGDVIEYNSEVEGSGFAQVIDEVGSALILERLLGTEERATGKAFFQLDVKKDTIKKVTDNKSNVLARKRTRIG